MSVIMVRQKVKDGSVEAALANPYVWMGLAPGASLGDVERADRRLAMHLTPATRAFRRSYADERSN